MDAVRVGLVGAGFMGKIHSVAYRNAAMLFVSGPTFVVGLRVAEVTDAVIEAAASGSSVAVTRRAV